MNEPQPSPIAPDSIDEGLRRIVQELTKLDQLESTIGESLDEFVHQDEVVGQALREIQQQAMQNLQDFQRKHQELHQRYEQATNHVVQRQSQLINRLEDRLETTIGRLRGVAAEQSPNEDTGQGFASQTLNALRQLGEELETMKEAERLTRKIMQQAGGSRRSSNQK